MKTKLLTAISLFLLVACKKSYTCVCTTTYVYQQSNGRDSSLVNNGNSTAYSEKMTKKQATAACQHEQTALQTDFSSGITNSNSAPLRSGESISASCELK